MAAYKNITTDRTDIGESWEISGYGGRLSVVDRGEFKGLNINELAERFGEELLGSRVVGRYGRRFPLLVKFISAHDDLSVQVHPDDALAARDYNSMGKTELWYIIKTTEEARIVSGVSRDFTPEEFDRMVGDGTFGELLEYHDAVPGDIFFIPSGTVHAIGRGTLLVEVQQASDITFRIFDYNRPGADGKPRQLHVKEAREALDYNRRGDLHSHIRGDRPVETIKECDYFKTSRVVVDGEQSLPTAEGSFTIVVCVAGSAVLSAPGMDSVEIPTGDTWLIPASFQSLTASGKASLIVTTV